LNSNRTALHWRPSTEPDEFGGYVLTARAAGGYKFTLYPGSFFTLVAECKGARLFAKSGNEPGPLKAAATRYIRQAVSQ
jgi:hypothetical protein